MSIRHIAVSIIERSRLGLSVGIDAASHVVTETSHFTNAVDEGGIVDENEISPLNRDKNGVMPDDTGRTLRPMTDTDRHSPWRQGSDFAFIFFIFPTNRNDIGYYVGILEARAKP